MKLFKLSPVALATTLALGLAAPAANAGMSASAAVSNFYLWRGLDISAGAPEVSGSLDYKHDSGAYAGIWASSEDAGTETDLYAGFAGSAGGLTYDISYWEYYYPSDNSLTPPGDAIFALSEYVIGVGYAGAGLKVYTGADTNGGADYKYVTLDYTMGAFNILYGTWMIDASGADESSHITLSYAVADNFKFIVSKGMQDTAASVYDEDLLFNITYSLPIEIK
jgi:uncharacterized protein (TIGR02001 family)